MPETESNPQAPPLFRAFNKTADWAKSLYDDFKEFLSPSACLCCGRERDFPDPLLCPGCIDNLTRKNIGGGPICPFCGRPVGSNSTCELCRKLRPLDLLFWGIYDEELKDCLLQFKFHGALELGKKLSMMAVNAMDERLSRNGYDYLIPIPLHKDRQKERHYNQSEIIAVEISRMLNIKLLPCALQRDKATNQQAKLAEKDRWNNVRDAFVISSGSKELLKGRTVLLVDDIVTTGATVFEASRPIMEAGVERLDIFSLAYAK
jgi:competence protein ComFC